MGFVTVTGRLGRGAVTAREIQFLVDSGAFYTCIPPQLAADIGLETPITTPVVLANQRRIDVPIGVAYLVLDGREGGIAVAVMDVPMPLLGVSALEALGFKIDPVGGRLEPTRPFGPAVLTVVPLCL